MSKMQTMRISAATHKDVSLFAAKREARIVDVGDEIVRAGLAALAGNGHAATPPSRQEASAPIIDGDADGLLRAALDADALKLVRDYRDEIAARPKRAEKLSLAETAGRLIRTGWNRLVAVQKHAGRG